MGAWFGLERRLIDIALLVSLLSKMYALIFSPSSPSVCEIFEHGVLRVRCEYVPVPRSREFGVVSRKLESGMMM